MRNRTKRREHKGLPRGHPLALFDNPYFRTLWESATDAMALSDRNGVVLTANPAYLQLYGFTAEEVIGQSFAIIFPEEARPQALQDYKTVFATLDAVPPVAAWRGGADRPASFESTVRRADGEVRTVESRIEFIYEAGQRVAMLSIIRDITAHKQAEEALDLSEARQQSSEARQQSLVEIMPSAMFICDREGLITYYNQRAVELWGRRPKLLDPEDRFCGSFRIYRLDGAYLPHHECPMAVAVLTGQGVRHQEIMFERPDGTTIFVSVNINPLHDPAGRRIGALNVFEDITHRKVAEEQLQAYARRLEALNRIHLSVAAELDLQRLLQLVTDVATEWIEAEFGAFFYNVDNAAGEAYTLYTLSGVPREAFAPFPMPRNTLLFGPTFRSEEIIRLADVTQDPRYGHNAPYQGLPPGHLPVRSYLAVPVISRTGEVIGGLFFGHRQPALFTEQSEQLVTGLAAQAAVAIENAHLYARLKDREATLRELTATLEQRVQERTAELERSNQELNEFAHVASHDLKAPLRSITHLANWIAEDAGKLLPAASQEHLTKLRGRIKRMEVLLDDLLAYSRVGRQRHLPEAVNLPALLEKVVELLAPPPGFTIKEAATSRVLYTERVPLETILRNLIDNAIKHHPQPSAGWVEITVQEQGEWVEFMVRDNGPGIDPAFHGRIFDIFQTLQSRDEIAGSGMGLTVVKKLVERRGGTVAVTSAVGAGATFRFTWPTAAALDAVDATASR